GRDSRERSGAGHCRHSVPGRCPGHPRTGRSAPSGQDRTAGGGGVGRLLSLVGKRRLHDGGDRRRQRRPLHGLTESVLSYDLHLHPGPSVAPRWGDGRRVWDAAAAAGVHGFVWKAHERHTAELCRELPAVPVRAIGSASLNGWATARDVMEAVDAGARWIWGPTLTGDGSIGWELPLPGWWDDLAGRLSTSGKRLVL